MAKQYIRYDKDEIARLVQESQSFSEILVKLGKKPVGGQITHLSLMCRRWGIDTSQMAGQGHNKGKPARHKRPAYKVLVMGQPNDHRVHASVLRPLMIEVGFEYKCASCGITDWLGAPIVLDVDHIDSQSWNNSQENLQFLCPNCHRQKTITAK